MTDPLRLLLGLVTGGLGGTAFWLLGLPLPWMLGALFATMAAALAGVQVKGPSRIRPAVVAVIGVMLGARFSPEVMAQAMTWTGTLAILLVYLVCVALVVVPFYRVVGRMDWATAYFAGMPGGLSEMIEMGEAKGADILPIVLAHSLRIVVTITLIAVWFRLIQGHAVGGGPIGPAALALGWQEAGLLLAAAVLGSVVGRALRLPAPTFLGPMAVSAALHLSGISEAAPPGGLVNAAQVLLGTVLGCRFRGVPLAALRRASWLSVVSTLLSLGIAFGFALLMRHLTGVEIEQALLAMAPGGLTEMGLMALAIHADVAFVALHHVVRIVAVLVLAPLVFRLVAEGRKPPAG